MMTVFVVILFLLFLTFGSALVALGLGLYLFVWSATGKHECKPALIFGGMSLAGLLVIWAAIINFIQVVT
jgi:hypothetical protein